MLAVFDLGDVSLMSSSATSHLMLFFVARLSERVRQLVGEPRQQHSSRGEAEANEPITALAQESHRPTQNTPEQTAMSLFCDPPSTLTRSH